MQNGGHVYGAFVAMVTGTAQEQQVQVHRSPALEVLLQHPEIYMESVKRKRTLAISQVVEERLRTDLESRFSTKVKSSVGVEAEPPELHFSGFEVGKDYKKAVNLVNISAKVLDIRVLPTQTQYFRTKYTQTTRLLPGLSLSVTVHFHPDDWRYFFDGLRVYCKGEEDLLVPIHAYPVIDNLHLPTCISLPTIPLGYSATHVIPLSCSCPVDFEFQVHYLQSHKAFSIHPISGVIPANGKTDVSVTFMPRQYGTAEITVELVISQFNLKPLICTLTASCFPQGQTGESAEMVTGSQKTKRSLFLSASPRWNLKVAPSTRKHTKKKVKSDPHPQISGMDVLSLGGLAKLLIQHPDKMNFRNLREAVSHSKTALQTRQIREAAYENQVRVKAQQEKATVLRWQVRLGDDLISTEQKIKVLKEQELASLAYRMQKISSSREGDVARTFRKQSSHRVLRAAGQHPDGTPVFSVHGCSRLQVRQRVLRLFQQAVRKVILQIRMTNRLRLLRELACSSREENKARGNDTGSSSGKQLLNLASEKLPAFEWPDFNCPNCNDELGVNSLGHVPVTPIEISFTPSAPFFNLKVPQRYRITGYQEVPVYDAKTFAVNAELPRLLRTGAEDELVPDVTYPSLDCHEEKEQLNGQGPEQKRNHVLLCDSLKSPLKGHPFRIFNPAPGVYAFKPAPLYPESDFGFSVCPLSRQKRTSKVPRRNAQKEGKEDVLFAIWKNFPCQALTTLNSVSTLNSSWAPHISDSFNSSVLPMEAPPTLRDPPEGIAADVTTGLDEATGFSLTPEMVHAEFALLEDLHPKTFPEYSDKDDKETRQQLPQATLQSQVLARIKSMKQTGHVV